MPDHFGNLLLEQRKLLAGDAFVERTDQAVIRVSGTDAKTWLHSLLSQDILNLEARDSTEALLLSPQGQIEHQIKIYLDEQDALLLITAETRVDSLISWLEKMKFRSKVIIERTALRTFGVFSSFEGQIWVDHFSIPKPTSVSYNPNRASFSYFEIISESAPDLEPAGILAYHALRIAAGRPEINDTDEKALPHEFDWLSSAVHLSKGCYRGQETVSKVHNLGHPPRRLALLNLETGDDLANKDDLVFYGDKQVGKIVASALHFERGSIALALLSRNTPYLNLVVEIGSHRVEATQEVLVPADAGKAANLPRPSSFKLSGSRN
jgi:tRNA-modifying protein YgfZ